MVCLEGGGSGKSPEDNKEAWIRNYSPDQIERPVMNLIERRRYWPDAAL